MTSEQKLATIIEKAEQVLALDTRNEEEGSSISYSEEYGCNFYLVSKKLKKPVNNVVVRCSVEVAIKDGDIVRSMVIEMFEDGCGRVVKADEDSIVNHIDMILSSLK